MTQLESRYIKAKRKLFDTFYGKSNPEQRRAIFTTNGPLLVLAGAGSGKTTVLVQRIAYIIKYGNAYMSEYVPRGITEDKVSCLESAAELSREQIEPILDEFIEYPCPPYRMLAITFTNKAANEIKRRLESVFDSQDVSDIWAGTFHSICMRILRTYPVEAGLARDFSIYDTDDTKKAVSAAMKRCNIDEKILPLKSVVNEISRSKDQLIGPEEYMHQNATDYRRKQIARIYIEYQNAMTRSNAVDFDDIIFKTVMLLKENAEIREKYQKRFKYVSVDEYQDTNQAQFALTALLSDGYRNLMVVGDDDQSIYRFRGATIGNILGFDRHYDDATVIKLEQNYRSTGNILGAANEIISHNTTRHGKTLWTDKGNGEAITVCGVADQNSEARYITETISRLVRENKYHCRDFAVLYRTNVQSQAIESAFAKSGIPYRTLGTTRFFDRKEIRDIVAYLHIINNPSDNERLKRIINEPKRAIGAKAVSDIEILANNENCSMFDIISRARQYATLNRYAAALSNFHQLITGLTFFAENSHPSELIEKVFEMSGYRQMLIDGGESERDRIENIEELISSAVEHQKGNAEASLTGYLEEVALVSDVDKYDENADAAIMMTIHSAKGLEFPVVFLPGMEDGLFPGMQTITAAPDEMEEERRLAYVAVTRAKEKLYILYAHNRMLWGRSGHNPPSRFISEIPERYIMRPNASSSQQHTVVQARSYIKQSNSAVGDRLSVNKPVAKRPAQTAALEKLCEGDRVHHRIFGDGEILSVRDMGADIMYEVVFDNVGTKKLMATFANLKKI